MYYVVREWRMTDEWAKSEISKNNKIKLYIKKTSGKQGMEHFVLTLDNVTPPLLYPHEPSVQCF